MSKIVVEDSVFTCDCVQDKVRSHYDERYHIAFSMSAAAVEGICHIHGLCMGAGLKIMAEMIAKSMNSIREDERPKWEDQFMLLLESEFARSKQR